MLWSREHEVTVRRVLERMNSRSCRDCPTCHAEADLVPAKAESLPGIAASPEHQELPATVKTSVPKAGTQEKGTTTLLVPLFILACVVIILFVVLGVFVSWW